MSEVQETKVYFGRNLMEGGKKLYLNAKTADVHFSFTDDDGTVKRVPAHKSILAVSSDVFEAMFYGDLREKGDVQLTDATEAAFTEFLQFFYLTRIKLTIDNIAGVMYLGDKYDVPSCLNVCVQFLKDVLTVDNVFIGFDLAFKYDQEELKKSCKNFIALNTAEVFRTDGFLECDGDTLTLVLQMDVFSCSEAEVFKACMAWVRAKSKQSTLTKAMVKKHLGNLYYDEIRFKSMTVPELCELQTEYEPVLRGDFTVLTNMIAVPNFQTNQFNTQLRHAKWDLNHIVKCNLNQSDGVAMPYICQSKETVAFASDEPLLLGGFVCNMMGVLVGQFRRDLSSDLPVDVEISEASGAVDANAKVLLTMRTTLNSSDANHIQLPHPILIRPKLRYTISIGSFPDQHLFYSKELKKSVLLSRNSIMVNLLHWNICDQNEKAFGLVSCLHFNPL